MRFYSLFVLLLLMACQSSKGERTSGFPQVLVEQDFSDQSNQSEHVSKFYIEENNCLMSWTIKQIYQKKSDRQVEVSIQDKCDSLDSSRRDFYHREIARRIRQEKYFDNDLLSFRVYFPEAYKNYPAAQECLKKATHESKEWLSFIRGKDKKNINAQVIALLNNNNCFQQLKNIFNQELQYGLQVENLEKVIQTRDIFGTPVSFSNLTFQASQFRKGK